MNEYESMNGSERKKREKGREKLNGAAESMRRKVRRSVHDLVMMILTTHHSPPAVSSTVTVSQTDRDTYILD